MKSKSIQLLWKLLCYLQISISNVGYFLFVLDPQLVLAVFASAAAEPLVFSSPYLASPFVSPYASAALVAPGAPGVVAQAAAVPAGFPMSSVSAYSYGSSYSIQDYTPLVNTAAAPLYSSAYSLPYTYADWFYRR